MRYFKFIAAFILSTSLIFILSISSFAASDTENMPVIGINTMYQKAGGDGYRYHETLTSVDPTIAGKYKFRIPGTVMLDQIEYHAVSMNILSYTDSIELWQQGYIYTFSYEIRINSSSVPEPNSVTFSFGAATLDDDIISSFMPLGDVIYSYSLTTSYTTYYVKSIVYVDENFNSGDLELYSSYCSLEFHIYEQESVTIIVDLNEITAEKAIGEDAYYQASVDALNDLNSTMNGVNSSVNAVNSSVNEVNSSVNEVNQTLEDLPEAQVDAEYNFVLNSMPDDDGTIEIVTGDYDEFIVSFKNDANGFSDMIEALSTSYTEPVIFMPNINIPLGDGVNINLNTTAYGSYVNGNYFKPLSYLSMMNGSIVTWISTALVLVRLILAVTFVTYGLQKMLRVEWWLN